MVQRTREEVKKSHFQSFRVATFKKKKKNRERKFTPNVTLFFHEQQQKRRVAESNDDDKNAPRGLFSAAGVLFPRRWWCVCLFLLLFYVNSIFFLSLSLSPIGSICLGGR